MNKANEIINQFGEWVYQLEGTESFLCIGFSSTKNTVASVGIGEPDMAMAVVALTEVTAHALLATQFPIKEYIARLTEYVEKGSSVRTTTKIS